MKKLILLFCLLPMVNVGCGDDGTPPEPAIETLNKELLYDKQWSNESRTIVHIFNSDGTYATLGTWAWINNSDTMKVHENGTNKDFTWVINKGNTADKMEAKLHTGNSWGEYRTSW
ncbi:MAG: hypothetical protein ACI9JN_000579 [Bacteroidia bacterium]|jgi:hypothetical protein